MNIYKKINIKIKDKEYFQDLLFKNDREMRLITFLNPFSYNVFIKYPELIDKYDSFYADGALLVKLHNLFNTHKINRVSFDFSSIAKDVLEYANNNLINIAFIGAQQNEIDTAINNIKIMYPNISIVYLRNGYFNSNEEYKCCFKDMNILKIDILIIGMGSPHQENFAVKVKDNNLDIPLVYTCGGFLTQTAIKADYYYPIVKKLGLRWLQRAIMHKHVRDRLIKDYPLFVIKYIYNQFKGEKI